MILDLLFFFVVHQFAISALKDKVGENLKFSPALCVTSYFLIFAFFGSPAFFSIFEYFFSFFAGTVTLAFALILLNALLPIEVMPFAFFILTVFSLLQPANAFLPIFFTLLPMVTFFSFLQFLKAFLLIWVTL